MCSQFLLTLLLLLLPGSIQEELGIPPVFPVSSLGHPGQSLSTESFPSWPLPTAPFREVGTAQGGSRRLAHGSVSKWAPAGPVAGAGWQLPGAGRPGSPSPAHPWHCAPPASGFSSRQRGQGGLAGLQGWAGGFPLWALFPPGTFPNARQVEEWQAHSSWPPQHPHHLPLQ